MTKQITVVTGEACRNDLAPNSSQILTDFGGLVHARIVLLTLSCHMSRVLK